MDVVATAPAADDDCGWDVEERREAPPTKPASLFLLMSAVLIVPPDSCLERRLSLLSIDLKPLDEFGDVGEVTSEFAG